MVKMNVIEKVKENIPLSEKVSFLKQPGAYQHPGVKVETKETHTSWVFLVDDFAYKLKKPVHLRFLNLRTLEARLKNCQEEIRLNKRLAADLYVGIVSLVLNEEGKLQLEGKGRVIDWLVKMKRIPEENLLDYAIRHHRADKGLVEGAAVLLAQFYKKALPVYLKPDLYRRKLKKEIISTRIDLLHPL